jgi:hypothetical protein
MPVWILRRKALFLTGTKFQFLCRHRIVIRLPLLVSLTRMKGRRGSRMTRMMEEEDSGI